MTIIWAVMANLCIDFGELQYKKGEGCLREGDTDKR